VEPLIAINRLHARPPAMNQPLLHGKRKGLSLVPRIWRMTPRRKKALKQKKPGMPKKRHTKPHEPIEFNFQYAQPHLLESNQPPNQVRAHDLIG